MARSPVTVETACFLIECLELAYMSNNLGGDAIVAFQFYNLYIANKVHASW